MLTGSQAIFEPAWLFGCHPHPRRPAPTPPTRPLALAFLELPKDPTSRTGRLPVSRRYILVLLAGSLPALVGGCLGQPNRVAPAELPVVPVSTPVEREVSDYVDFTGRTDAV